jgi:hypothetical protein
VNGWLDAEPTLDGQEALQQTATYCAVELGWKLVPMEPQSKAPHPGLLPGQRWKHLRSTPTTPEAISAWYESDPSFGISVITGPCSGNLVVVDVDHPSKFPSAVLPIPPSPQVCTPRGFRALYVASRPIRGRKSAWGEVLFGSLAVLPPSVHPSGERYTWSDGLAPWQVELAELPEPFYALCEKKAVEPRPRKEPLHVPKGDRWLLSNLRLNRDVLLELFSRESVVRPCAELLGIPDVPLGSAFRCILPGHEENTPSASLYRSDNGVIVYHDWHAREGTEFLTLPEVRASKSYGRLVTLRDHAPEAATWGIRLLIEARVLRPAKSPVIQLPNDAPFSAVRVAEGFSFLLACKWLYEPDASTVYSKRFAAVWCGIGEVQAWEGISYLLENGYLRIAGKHKGAPLYVPKEGKAIVHLE